METESHHFQPIRIYTTVRIDGYDYDDDDENKDENHNGYIRYIRAWCGAANGD